MTLAALVIGHGSLHLGSGAAMIRLASRLTSAHGIPLTGAGFLNFSEPDFGSALERLINKGATKIIVLPYFLVPGYFVRVSLAEKVAQAQEIYPNVDIQLAEPLGDHPAMAELVVERAKETSSSLPESEQALLILVHGSPRPESNEPIYRVAKRIERSHGYALVRVCFMDHNDPPIAAAIAEAATLPTKQILAVPYFLQEGGHVREDLPAAIAAGHAAHPEQEILLGDYLGYHELIAQVLADRIGERCVNVK